MADLNEVSHDKDRRRERTRLVKSEKQAAEDFTVQTISNVNAVPTLLALVTLLLNLVDSLPELKCPACESLLLPENPSASTENELQPEMLICKHWYHSACLHKYLISPPFDKPHVCHICKEVIQHKKWSEAYIRKAQKNFERKLEKEREIDDVAELFL